MLGSIFYFADRKFVTFFENTTVSQSVEFSARLQNGCQDARPPLLCGPDSQINSRKIVNHSRWVIACSGSYFVHSTYARQEKGHFLGFSTTFPGLIFWRESTSFPRRKWTFYIHPFMCLWSAWQAWRYAINVMHEGAEMRDGFWQDSLDLIPEMNRLLRRE